MNQGNQTTNASTTKLTAANATMTALDAKQIVQEVLRQSQ